MCVCVRERERDRVRSQWLTCLLVLLLPMNIGEERTSVRSVVGRATASQESLPTTSQVQRPTVATEGADASLKGLMVYSPAATASPK